MKTSSFRLYTGPGRISIARWAPRDCPKGFRVFKPLAPGDWSRAHRSWVDYDTFLRGYAQQLAALDPQATYDALTALVAPEEPVLLCWEVPPMYDDGKQWCHRQQVARWFEQALGIEVGEL
jgi:hypothetical protein